MPPQRQHHFAKPKNLKVTLRRTLGVLHPYRGLLFLASACVILHTAAGLYATYLLKPLIDDCLMPFLAVYRHTGEVTTGPLVHLMYHYLGAGLTGIVSGYGYRALMVHISTACLYKIRLDIFRKMEQLPIKYFVEHRDGETMSLFTNDVNSLREMLSQSLPDILRAVVRLFGVIGLMLLLSPLLTVVTLTVTALMGLISKFFGKRSSVHFKARQDSLALVNGYIEELIEGHNYVKAYSHEQKAIEEFALINERLRQAECSATTYAGTVFPIMGNLNHVMFAITACLGGVLISAHNLQVGAVAAFLQYTRGFSMPINQLSQQMSAVFNALAGAERIFALIDTPSEVDAGQIVLVPYRTSGLQHKKKRHKRQAADTGSRYSHKLKGHGTACHSAWKVVTPSGKVELHPLRGCVELHDVTFSYLPGSPVLKNISIKAEPGQRVAFVGSTGAGKTTITNLINRFYDLDSGYITYDGLNIKDIAKQDLRSTISMVLQDTHLFTGTVADNIRFSRPEASDQEVERAARLANAHNFIKHLPQGYRTMLSNDGASLSQGQRQLLAIARAACTNPTLLILDEATSSVDTKTETAIERGMATLMSGRTVFVIAHRLSTVRSADIIAVLENGRIIEQGSHRDLLALGGRYSQLHQGMFELD